MTFTEFKKKYPQTAQDIENMTKSELLEQYLSEVTDKEFHENNHKNLKEDLKDSEFLMNLCIKWLTDNKTPNHAIFISHNTAKIYNTETEFI